MTPMPHEQPRSQGSWNIPESALSVQSLQSVIGYHFYTDTFLHRALTRLAWAKEQGLDDDAHMDALATLGDAVIELIALDTLVHAGITEKGHMSKIKMNNVNMSVLRDLALQINLQDYVYWGRGEAHMQIWTSGRVLAECMEALIGAIYLDGGIDAARSVLCTCGFLEKLTSDAAVDLPKLPKTKRKEE